MNLRKTLAVLSIAGLFLVPSLARSSDAEEVTVNGEILDMACYVAHEAMGADHAKCAVKCVKAGQPMGLRAADGTVYLLFADHGDASAYEEAKEFAGKDVEIRGSVSARDGVKAITVHGVKAL